MCVKSVLRFAMKWLNRIGITLVIFGIGFMVGLVIAWQPLPMEKIYEDYNSIQIFEDGSYKGKTRAGIEETGCIIKAQCND